MSYYKTITNLPIEGLGASLSFSWLLGDKPTATATTSSTTQSSTLSTTQTVFSQETLDKMKEDARLFGMALAQQAAGAAALEAQASASAKAASQAALDAARLAAVVSSVRTSAEQASAAASANAAAMGAERMKLEAADKARAAATAADALNRSKAEYNASQAKIAELEQQLVAQKSSTKLYQSAAVDEAASKRKMILVASILGVSLLAGGVYMVSRKRAAQ